MEDKRFGCLRKGNPRILGVTEDQEGYSFALAVPEGRQVSLLLYKKGDRAVPDGRRVCHQRPGDRSGGYGI